MDLLARFPEADGVVGLAACPEADLEDSLWRILTAMLKAVRAPVGMILLREPETNRLGVAVSAGLRTTSAGTKPGWTLAPDEGLIGRVAETRQPIHHEQDYSYDPGAHPSLAEAEGLNSFIGTPITIHGENTGVLAVFTRHPDRFSEPQVLVVGAMAEIAGSVIRQARDVDACVQAAGQAKLTCELFDTITECIDDGIAVIEGDSTISYANQAFARQAGMKTADVLGQKCYWVSHKRKGKCQPPEHACPMEAAYQTGVPQTAVHQHVDTAGNATWVEVSCSPVVDEHGTIMRAVEVTRDITRRRKMEQELLQAEKLAALGQMATTMAHEIRNPLAGMRGALDVIRSKGDAQPYHGVLNDIIEQIDRLTETTSSLLSFSRPIAPRRVPTDIREVIATAHSLFEEQARTQGTEVVLDLETTSRLVLLDPQITARALLNIALNALQAMRSGGRLTITAREDPRNYVLTVALIDTGPGMSSDVMDQIFTPFFSTKVRGTGLGLCVVQEIIERQGGNVEVRSTPGNGTSFVVTLPMV